MTEANTTPGQNSPAPPAIPDPQDLQPGGLTNKHKRYIYFGVAAVIVILILANIVGSNQTTPPKLPEMQGSAAQEQNPSPAQIRDWENNLKQAKAQLQEETRERQRQLDAVRAAQQGIPAQTPMTAEDLQQPRHSGTPPSLGNNSSRLTGQAVKAQQARRNPSYKRKKSSRLISRCLPTISCGKNPRILPVPLNNLQPHSRPNPRALRLPTRN